jgi:Pentapeptide repeats (8 copies)
MPRGPSSRRIPVGTIIILALFGFLLLYLVLKAYTEPSWSAIAGFRETTVSRTETTNVYNREGEIEKVTTQEVLPQRTVWDWLSLVGIPLAGGIVIAGVGYAFNRKQREREEAVERLNAQDTALQSYLDQMSDLLVNQHLRSLPRRSDIHKLGEARTLAALLGLDSDHKRRPLKLVYDLGLITIKEPLFELENAGLDQADLSELSLRGASVRRADLRGANLHGADLSRSDLSDADLSRANLLPYDERHPAKLSIHNLKDHALPSQKELRFAKAKYYLTGIGHRTHITLVDLTPADLTNTKLEGAILTSAILANTDLRSVRGLTQEQVDSAIGNHKTKLPDPLKRPKAWEQPIEEQIKRYFNST